MLETVHGLTKCDSVKNICGAYISHGMSNVYIVEMYFPTNAFNY